MSTEPGLVQFNELNAPALLRLLLGICQSPTWRNDVNDGRPYADLQSLLDASDKSFVGTTDLEIEESVLNHPRIGAKNAGPRSSREQSRFADTLDPETFADFAELNQQYENKFGYLFLVAADGRSAQDLLAALKQRLQNDQETERSLMRQELAKITRLRLARLLVEDFATA